MDGVILNLEFSLQGMMRSVRGGTYLNNSILTDKGTRDTLDRFNQTSWNESMWDRL